MPTYEYECSACEHEFELFQKMGSKPKKQCPKCGKQTAKRLIGSGGGVLFKGSGFYETDYRSESYKKAAKADSEPAAKSDKSDKGSDSKKGTKSSSSSKSADSAPSSGASKSASE